MNYQTNHSKFCMKTSDTLGLSLEQKIMLRTLPEHALPPAPSIGLFLSYFFEAKNKFPLVQK